jgi:hypothetical protein
MKAYDKGFRDGRNSVPKAGFRAFESDRANKEYFRGYADGVAATYPTRTIVKCPKDSAIFAAIPEPYMIPREGLTAKIDCPVCGRGYFQDNDTGEFVCESALIILRQPSNADVKKLPRR